ncbi:PRELI-like family-domain-containing protein [Phyllosticta citribraziliensis]
MKIFSTSHDFNYSWEEVSIANWRKYSPWNKKTPHVIAVDTLERHVDPHTGILRTERLITCQQSAPKWLSSFLGGQEVSHVYETSYVDAHGKTVTMCSMNMTWSDLLSVRETVVYKPCAAARASKTTFEQTAQIVAMCGGWNKVKNSIEAFTMERFSQNAAKGREGFEMVLEMSRRVFAQERERLAQQVEAKL